MRVATLMLCLIVGAACASSQDSFAQAIQKTVERDSLPVAANGGKFVEYYWKRPAGAARYPVIVLIHGHQDGRNTRGGKAFVDFGVLDSAVNHGYVGVSVSQPGYGHSAGPADFMGPASVAAVQTVIDHFRAQPFVKGDRVALEGVSRGAIVASLVAVNDSTIRAMVLISGEYDFASPIDATTPAGRRALQARDFVRPAIVAETDGSAAALRVRSALLQANRIRTPALLLNGQQDDRTDPAQAQALAERLTANGVAARSIVYPSLGHAIPYALRERDIRPFLEMYLRNP
jgi:dipeptidyl aminopeptidase/acylaminoacyl peptidase